MTTQPAGRRLGVWWAGLVVAGAAAAATAHGLYAVSIASGVPAEIAALYPVMADGLALVAYSATSQLRGGARRYAWMVVLAAAGLSGLAQALYLAGGGVQDAPAGVRFGIGAIPAVAAAAVAHLLHLIRTALPAGGFAPDERPGQGPPSVQPAEAAPYDNVQREAASPAVVRPERPAPQQPAVGSAASRAEQAARRHRADRGTLPTTSELVRLAGVSRGTAGIVLKGLRTDPSVEPEDPPRSAEPDHAVPQPDVNQRPHIDHPSHPGIKIRNHDTPRHHDPKEDRLRRAEAPVEARG
jgi:hypothetical protein